MHLDFENDLKLFDQLYFHLLFERLQSFLGPQSQKLN